MKVTQNQIDNFLDSEKIAIAGVSRDIKKFGYAIFRELRFKGYNIIPINPNAENIDDVKCYKSVSDIPNDVDSLLIATSKEKTDDILRVAINKGIKNIWVQQHSNTQKTIDMAKTYDKKIIAGKCIFMFAEPVNSIHKFHKGIVKVFGGLPKYEEI